MDVGAVGINHKTSSLSMREIIAGAAMRASRRWDFPKVVLSTCNRTEIYFSGEDLSAIHAEVLEGLRAEIDIDFEHELYGYFHGDCFRHLAQVTTGLDSAIFAECDIQRQVKLAYQSAQIDHELPAPLHFLFQKCLKIGKEIRSFFPTIRPQIALEQILYDLSREIFRSEEKVPLLMIGNSQINRKILAFLRHKKGIEITLCTRSPSSAKELEEKYDIQVKDWTEIDAFSRYKFVISGSRSSNYLIKKGALIPNSLLIADLSLPRTVDPQIGRHPKVQLYNIDELSQMIDQTKSRQMQEVFHAHYKVEESVAKQLSIFSQKTLVPVCV